MASEMANSTSQIVELNVGGVGYTTTIQTLTKEPESYLGQVFRGKIAQIKDSKGRYFIDRDGVLFRYILDYLRNQKIILPESFAERDRLRAEAEFYKLETLAKALIPLKATSADELTSSLTPLGITSKAPGYVMLGYRGTFAFGRDGLADVKFRKLSRILVSGRVTLCREIFGETLNESRDPDRGMTDRYSSRFFLKHSYIEQAFDMLQEAGFSCVASCGSGTASIGPNDLKPGMDSEENRWNHYNEFVFVRN
ncbi:BTB/POZ domain-containing protein KCTD16-like [Artemia franciscana]|uniref:BTB domain-containing protein n=1 Tax=Artemia franciscana TaxID=6661 RepID=A0AA88HMG4_ARTSF|nr:hypothetical protein QYM36_011622 [Artemia franciscana]